MITLINHQGLKVMKGLQLQSPSPSIGLAYIGAFLRQNGFAYTGIDACGLAMDRISPYKNSTNIFIQGLSVAEVVAKVPSNTSLIGFTCLFSHCWPLVADMARELRKKFPKAIFVAGGEHPTAAVDQVLNDPNFDIVVTGEGEETFLELARHISAGSDWSGIDGISYVKNGSVIKNNARKRVTDIDQFPTPDWDEWCLRAYIDHQQVTGINLGRMMPILGSRGCPYACKFCSNEHMWTRRYIMRDPTKLVNEMEFLKNKYSVNGFTFMDSTFVVNRRKTLTFAKELVARKLDVTYQLPAGTRCEAFDAELAQELAESGLRNFAFAPESASVEILDAIRKQVEIPKLIDSIKVVLKTPMTVGCFFVIGFPEDTKESMQATLKLIRKLAFLGVHDVTVSKFTPYPGSDYFIELLNKGKFSQNLVELENVIDFYSSDSKSFCESLNSDQLYRWMIWMYLNFYIISFLCRPHRVIKNFMRFVRFGIEETRYMRLFGELFVRRKDWSKSLGTASNKL